MVYDGPPSKRSKVLSDLRAVRGCTKSGLAEILHRLHSLGELPSGLGAGAPRTIREQVQAAIAESVDMKTPYGDLIQEMPPAFAGRHRIPFVNPSAFLYILSSKCLPFFDSLVSGADATQKFRIMLYIDEVCPGNPMRPSKSRKTQALYWTIVDMPGHLLVQSSMWFFFTVLRSAVCDDIEGKVSSIIRHALHSFFPETGLGFTSGVVISHGPRSFLFRAIFGGFVADEKALKEIFSFKGASGTKPCMTCANVVQHIDGQCLRGTSLVNLSCSSRASFKYHTKDSIMQMVDRLVVAQRAGPKSRLNDLQQMYGITLNHDSLLRDQHCMQFVHPVEHYYRDWMHTFVSNGVAQTEVALFLSRLSQAGITNAMVKAFVGKFTLPKVYGTVDEAWFNTKPGGDMKVFASEMLSMIPLLVDLVQEVVIPARAIPEHVDCLLLLARIIEILSKGPCESMKHLPLLRESIVDHHVLFAKLYPGNLRPKLHHALHIPENMAFVGKLLSCFPTERKHRSTKQKALHVFRHYESTVLKDLVHEQFQRILQEVKFAPEYMIKASAVDDSGLSRATAAKLLCGEVHAGDLVLFHDGRAAWVDAFWEANSTILCQTRLLMADTAPSSFVAPNGEETFFAPVSLVRSALPWAAKDAGVYRVCLPLV